jgi:hypothetical protein
VLWLSRRRRRLLCLVLRWCCVVCVYSYRPDCVGEGALSSHWTIDATHYAQRWGGSRVRHSRRMKPVWVLPCQCFLGELDVLECGGVCLWGCPPFGQAHELARTAGWPTNQATESEEEEAGRPLNYVVSTSTDKGAGDLINSGSISRTFPYIHRSINFSFSIRTSTEPIDDGWWP